MLAFNAGKATLNVTTLLVTLPYGLDTTTSYVPTSAAPTLFRKRVVPWTLPTLGTKKETAMNKLPKARGGVADQRGAVGAPKAAGTGLAIGGLEDACGDLRRRQRRAVEDVERERAGGDVGLESQEAVGAPDAGRLNRILADDIDDAALRGIRNALAGKL